MSDYENAIALWQRRHITTDAELAEALSAFSIAFAYHSCKIENENVTYNDTREIFEHDRVTRYTGDLRTLFEIRNSKEANELLLTAFHEKRSVDEALVREFQRVLTQNTYDTRRWQLGERPGEYKRHGYVAGKNEICAAPEDVQEEMSNFSPSLEASPMTELLPPPRISTPNLRTFTPSPMATGAQGGL